MTTKFEDKIGYNSALFSHISYRRQTDANNTVAYVRPLVRSATAKNYCCSRSLQDLHYGF